VEILRSLNPNAHKKSKQTFNSSDTDTKDNGIINIIDFYPSPDKYHIVMELARGGDVFDRLAKRKVYTEKHARDLAKRMLESIAFLHSKGIAHRDIKPENLLLMDENSDTQLKLADFGFARKFNMDRPDDSMKTKCGTPAFVPPELVLGRKYGPKCDVWSAGCTLFMLLVSLCCAGGFIICFGVFIVARVMCFAHILCTLFMYSVWSSPIQCQKGW